MMQPTRLTQLQIYGLVVSVLISGNRELLSWSTLHVDVWSVPV
jgi:hypothetical protein